MLDSVSFETHIEAEENAEILVVPIDAFSPLLQNNVYVERDAYKKLSERFTDVISGIERMAFLNIEQRLALYFIDETHLDKTDVINKTHDQIATDIASAREVVSRALKIMADNDLVELSRGKIATY